MPKPISLWLIWRHQEERVISMHGRAAKWGKKKSCKSLSFFKDEKSTRWPQRYWWTERGALGTFHLKYLRLPNDVSDWFAIFICVPFSVPRLMCFHSQSWPIKSQGSVCPAPWFCHGYQSGGAQPGADFLPTTRFATGSSSAEWDILQSHRYCMGTGSCIGCIKEHPGSGNNWWQIHHQHWHQLHHHIW